jgi:hypothetical protein
MATSQCPLLAKAFRIEDMSMPVVSVGRDLPVPAYASVTH